MKKLFTLLTLLVAIVTGAWGTTELVYYNATGITVSGTTATMTSGLTLTQSNSRDLASGKNITCDGEEYQSFKLSTGSRNFTITAPTGNEITSITIYSYENNATPDGGAWTIAEGTEISNTAGTAFTKGSGDNATPDVQKFVFVPASSIHFSWTGKQNCCVLKVEYFSTSTAKYTLTAAANPVAGASNISEARDYYAGSTAYLTATAADGYAFTNWTDEGSTEISTSLSCFVTMPSAATTYTANFYSATTHTIIGAIADGQSSYGSITNEGSNNVVEDETITFTATANTGYAFVKWQKDGVDYSTDASVTITSSAANAATYTAFFVKLFKVTYDKSAYIGDINSSKILNLYNASVNEIYADKDGNYKIPAYADLYFYREGYTFDKWDDGNGNTYDSGATITGMTADVTLSPTWTATTNSLSDSQAQTVVKWSFAKADIVFTDWQSANYGYYTQKASINGEIITIPMQIVNGKVGNYGRSDALAQTNQNTKFTIPAVNGMTIAISDAYTDFSTTTIAGSTAYTGTGTKSISYTYTGTDETIDIVIGESGQYLTSIVVTYPVTAANVTITPAKEYTTYIAPANLDFTGLALKAYVATATTESSVTLDEVTTVPAGTALVLKKGSDASYDVPVIASASAPAKNLLKGSATASYKVAADGDAYVLSDGAFHPVKAGTLAAGKAYILKADVPSAAPMLSISFGDVTGINDVRSKMEEVRGDIYDMQGRKVAQPSKGLYIVNGKKIVIK